LGIIRRWPAGSVGSVGRTVVDAIPAWGLYRVLRALQGRPDVTRLVLDARTHPSEASVPIAFSVHQGRPRCVISDSAPFAFASHLVQVRAVPDAVIRDLQTRARGSGTPLCRLLREERAIYPEELEREHDAHLRRVLQALMPKPFASWTIGTEPICDGVCSIRGVDPTPVLLRSVAQSDDIESIRRIVSRFFQAGEFHLTPGYEVFLSAAALQFRDARTLYLLRQGRRRELADAISTDERELRVVFAFIAAGVLSHQPPAPGAVVIRDAPEDPVTRELHAAVSEYRSKNHYEVLGVSVEARVSEVEDAVRRLRKRFANARFTEHETPRTREYLDEIHRRVEDAGRILADRDLRTAYNRTLGEQARDLEGLVVRIFDARREWENGRRALEAGDLSEAVRRFQAAHEKDPDEPQYEVSLARAMLAQSPSSPALEEAAKRLASILEVRPEFVDAHLVLAQFLRLKGRKEEATGHVREALRFDPENAEARHLRELLSTRPPLLPRSFRKQPSGFLERLKRRLKLD